MLKFEIILFIFSIQPEREKKINKFNPQGAKVQTIEKKSMEKTT